MWRFRLPPGFASVATTGREATRRTTRPSRNLDPGDLAWVSALIELGQTASSRLEPSSARQAILRHIVSGLDAESGSIALVVEGSEEDLELVAGTDLPPGVVGSRLPRGVGVFGHVLATRQPLLVNGDVAETGLPLSPGARDHRSTESAMCWPLVVGDRIVGALAVNRNNGRARYSVDDLDRGQVLAGLLALVMANHRLHLEREARIAELSHLNAEMQRMNHQLADAHVQEIEREKHASLGQIAAGVAHEINNPVGYVSSNLSTLSSYMDTLFGVIAGYEAAASSGFPATGEPKRPSEQADVAFLREDIGLLLKETRDGVDRVRRIVQDLRDYSRGGAEDEWELTDLHEVLRRTVNIVRGDMKHKIAFELEPGTVPPVECLPHRMNQVFLNLVVNAGQAIAERGTVRITSGRDGEWAWFRVQDDGCGIPSEHLGRIFEPYFTTKPVGQGTGLGLSVSYAIVRRHGGYIEVESEAGSGTVFTVRLPLTQPRPDSMPPDADETIDLPSYVELDALAQQDRAWPGSESFPPDEPRATHGA
jgi:two-component system NtrC family sensor kinase